MAAWSKGRFPPDAAEKMVETSMGPFAGAAGWAWEVNPKEAILENQWRIVRLANQS